MILIFTWTLGRQSVWSIKLVSCYFRVANRYPKVLFLTDHIWYIKQKQKKKRQKLSKIIILQKKPGFAEYTAVLKGLCCFFRFHTFYAYTLVRFKSSLLMLSFNYLEIRSYYVLSCIVSIDFTNIYLYCSHWDIEPIYWWCNILCGNFGLCFCLSQVLLFFGSYIKRQ